MRSSFLWRNRVLLTSGVLLILSLHLISTGVHPGDLAARPQSAFLAVISPVTGAFTHLSDGASSITQRLPRPGPRARAKTRICAIELARVKSDQARLAELEVENQHLSELLELKDALGTNAVAANVIGSDANGISRTLVLASGSNEGLRPGMAVLANQGVVGKIIAVSPNASRVLLIDDHNSALDGFDQRTRARGIVAGHGRRRRDPEVRRSLAGYPRRRHDRDLGPRRNFPARPAGRHDSRACIAKVRACSSA